MRKFNHDFNKRVRFCHSIRRAEADKKTFEDYINGVLPVRKACKQISHNNEIRLIDIETFHNERRGCGYYTIAEELEELKKREDQGETIY